MDTFIDPTDPRSSRRSQPHNEWNVNMDQVECPKVGVLSQQFTCGSPGAWRSWSLEPCQNVKRWEHWISLNSSSHKMFQLILSLEEVVLIGILVFWDVLIEMFLEGWPWGKVRAETFSTHLVRCSNGGGGHRQHSGTGWNRSAADGSGNGEACVPQCMVGTQGIGV